MIFLVGISALSSVRAVTMLVCCHEDRPACRRLLPVYSRSSATASYSFVSLMLSLSDTSERLLVYHYALR